MPRKPNYGFERRERDRLKAEKKAERDKLKTERREANRAANAPAEGAVEERVAGGEAAETDPTDSTTKSAGNS
jgi:hypothetical protein